MERTRSKTSKPSRLGADLACNPLLRPILLGAWGHRLGSDSGRTTSKLEPFSEHGSVASSASATRTGASTLAAEPPPVHAQFSCSLFSTSVFYLFSPFLFFFSLFSFFRCSCFLSLSLSFPFFLSLFVLSLSFFPFLTVVAWSFMLTPMPIPAMHVASHPRGPSVRPHVSAAPSGCSCGRDCLPVAPMPGCVGSPVKMEPNLAHQPFQPYSH